MKTIIKSSWVSPLIWVALCIVLFSFSTRPGAHSFQVYVDNKIVIDQFANPKLDPQKLPLDQTASQLIVKYNECGRTVTGRTITVKDEKNKVLKEWSFEGATSGYKDAMTCSVKDIFALKKNGNNTLKLYYSSKDFPVGQQVAYLVLNGDNKTVGAQ
jgi:hypothetical protein